MKLQTAFMILALFMFGAVSPVIAQEADAFAEVSAKDDYITCWKQPCVRTAGITWSKENPNGVGISVRMGTKPVVTDDQIKEVLSRDFAKHGMANVKFFFEQNDAPATGIAFHIRGGVEGLFLIDTVREQVGPIAKRAKNTNPLFR